jgi:hypothetical protein
MPKQIPEMILDSQNTLDPRAEVARVPDSSTHTIKQQLHPEPQTYPRPLPHTPKQNSITAVPDDLVGDEPSELSDDDSSSSSDATTPLDVEAFKFLAGNKLCAAQLFYSSNGLSDGSPCGESSS